MGAGSPSVEDVVRRVVGETAHVKPEDVTRQRAMADFGMESMDVVEIVMAIQEECRVEIDRDALSAIVTVGDFIDHIEQLKASQT